MGTRKGGSSPEPTLPGLENRKRRNRGRLARATDAVIADARKEPNAARYEVDDLTAAMLRTAASNVERAIAEDSSWAVANALKELRTLRDELRTGTDTEGDPFDAFLDELAADTAAPGVPDQP